MCLYIIDPSSNNFFSALRRRRPVYKRGNSFAGVFDYVWHSADISLPLNLACGPKTMSVDFICDLLGTEHASFELLPLQKDEMNIYI